MTFEEFVAAHPIADRLDDIVTEADQAGWRQVPPEAALARLLDLLRKAWEAGHEAGRNASADLEEAGPR